MDDRTKIATMAMQGMLANNKRGPNSFGQYPHEYESFAAAADQPAAQSICLIRSTSAANSTASCWLRAMPRFSSSKARRASS